jgi:hypothetical protein
MLSPCEDYNNGNGNAANAKNDDGDYGADDD